LTQNFR